MKRALYVLAAIPLVVVVCGHIAIDLLVQELSCKRVRPER